MSKIKINKRFTLRDGDSKTMPVNPKGIGNSIGTDAYIQVVSLAEGATIEFAATMDNTEESMGIGCIDLYDYKGYEMADKQSVFLIPVTAYDNLVITANGGSADLIVKVVVE